MTEGVLESFCSITENNAASKVPREANADAPTGKCDRAEQVTPPTVYS